MNTHQKITDAQDLIIRKLASCEVTIGKLYETYAALYPDMAEFWLRISEEEKKHASLLEDVRSDLETGELIHGLGHFKQEQVQKVIDFVQEKIDQASKTPPTRELAVNTALSIESSVIDSRFFEFAKSDGSSFQKAAAQLVHETQGHIKMVKDARLALEQCR